MIDKCIYYKFKSLSRALWGGEGLFNREVYCIHQDRKGFIWVGTKYGLNRFDGHQLVGVIVNNTSNVANYTKAEVYSEVEDL